MEAKKVQLIRYNQWSAGTRASVKLLNPGKRFYLFLAIKSVAFINSMVDEDGMPLVRKVMIRCGLALNLTGRLEKKLNYSIICKILLTCILLNLKVRILHISKN